MTTFRSTTNFCVWLLSCCLIFTTTAFQGTYAGQISPSPALDSDHDGVSDAKDKCPNTHQVYKVDPNSRIAPLFEPEHLSKEPIAVKVNTDGCAIDSDKDGVADYQDYCPDDPPFAISAGVTNHGCAVQSDGDGTPDYRDKCPGTERGVPTDRFGCPKIIGQRKL